MTYPKTSSQVAAGDGGSAWNDLVDRHAAEVWRLVSERTSSVRAAAELFQLAWLRLELAARRDGMPEHLEAWFSQLVLREAASGGGPPAACSAQAAERLLN